MSDVLGIDVSEHNGALDWAKIKAAGVKFAIIRTGYGVSAVDSTFKANMVGAIANGVAVGVYHFSYALNAEGAKKEARQVLNIISTYKDKITLPVFFDFEYDTISYAAKNGVTLGREAFNNHAVAFCEEIEAAGYQAGVYYNLDYYNRFVNPARIGKYAVWYAQYNATPDISGWDIWQYSDAGTIPGLSGKFDLDRADESYITPKTYPEGWIENSTGWWYRYADGSFATGWQKIKGTWYHFGEDGYMSAGKLIDGKYYVGDDGALAVNKTLKINERGEIAPAGAYYYRLGDVPEGYRKELDKLVEAGKLKGKSGAGDDLVLDMTEDAVRVLIITNR